METRVFLYTEHGLAPEFIMCEYNPKGKWLWAAIPRPAIRLHARPEHFLWQVEGFPAEEIFPSDQGSSSSL
jgi:hypothetical protein